MNKADVYPAMAPNNILLILPPTPQSWIRFRSGEWEIPTHSQLIGSYDDSYG